MLDYFSYLRMTGQKDTKETYIKYLIEVVDYTKESAEKYSDLFYDENEKLKED